MIFWFMVGLDIFCWLCLLIFSFFWVFNLGFKVVILFDILMVLFDFRFFIFCVYVEFCIIFVIVNVVVFKLLIVNFLVWIFFLFLMNCVNCKSYVILCLRWV